MRFTTTLLVIIALACSSSTHAQCKFDEDKKDSFTGEAYKLSSTKIGERAYHWEVRLEKKGDNFRIGMIINWGRHVPEGINAEAKFLYLKLDNGDVITIEADKDYPVSHTPAAAQVISHFEPFGSMDEDVLRKLSKSPIVALKCVFGGVEQELTGIKKGQAQDIMKYAECLLKG